MEYTYTVGISADRVRYICQKSLLPYKILALNESGIALAAPHSAADHDYLVHCAQLGVHTLFMLYVTGSLLCVPQFHFISAGSLRSMPRQNTRYEVRWKYF